MKKYILLVLFIIVTLQANEKVSLQLSWKHQFQFAGYYVAKELGYYKEAGIDVDIKEFYFGVDLTQSVLDGSSDFAVGRSSIIIEKAEGKNIVAIAAIYQKSPLMLLVREDSGIKKLEDLKNKKIMITTDAKSTASIMAMLQSQEALW